MGGNGPDSYTVLISREHFYACITNYCLSLRDFVKSL